MPTKCSHEDSRISCVDCSAPLCGACLVQCPVGNRCKSCVGVGKVSGPSAGPLLVAKSLLMCGGIGCAAGWLMPYINIPFISCIICYYIGFFSGQWLAPRLHHNLGDKVGEIIVFGLLLGLTFSPMGMLPVVLVSMLQQTFANPSFIFNGLNAMVSVLFCPTLFVVGVLKSTIWSRRY